MNSSLAALVKLRLCLATSQINLSCCSFMACSIQFVSDALFSFVSVYSTELDSIHFSHSRILVES